MNKSSIVIGFLTSTDPEDKRSWSGTHYWMLNALRKQFAQVIILGPVKMNWWLVCQLRLRSLLHRIRYGGRFNYVHNVLKSKHFNQSIKKRLAESHIDVVFAPAASTEIACLETKVPICYLSDSSFGQLAGYYTDFSNLSGKSIQESNWIEQRAIDKAATLVYSSQWAADFVIQHYNADQAKIFVVPFGANLSDIPEVLKEKKAIGNNPFHLLFLGKEWERKGGEIVKEVYLLLKKMGHNVRLTICGCLPFTNDSEIQIIPFLNKNDPADFEKLCHLLQESHLLFVPSRADCSPIVFCEANAFGLPVLTTDTGGISSIIHHGENGFLLPMDAQAMDYAYEIIYLLEHPEIYQHLSISARKCYENRLNWDNWAVSIKTILLHTHEVCKT